MDNRVEGERGWGCSSEGIFEVSRVVHLHVVVAETSMCLDGFRDKRLC